jgi:Flp pilus assembly protein TadG
MVEATLAMPIALLLTLGTVDAALLLWEFNQAGKATDVGARAAALSDPVAIGINRPTYDPLLLGDSCFIARPVARV